MVASKGPTIAIPRAPHRRRMGMLLPGILPLKTYCGSNGSGILGNCNSSLALIAFLLRFVRVTVENSSHAQGGASAKTHEAHAQSGAGAAVGDNRHHPRAN